MKMLRVSLFFAIAWLIVDFAHGQNKKFDKSLRKIDANYAAGSYSKAKSGLTKLRSSVVSSMGQQNPYMPGLYIREARINLESGMLEGFESIIESAVNSSRSIYGETGVNYAATLVDVASIYNQYGYYRRSREYLDQSRQILSKNESGTEYLQALTTMVEAEAMTGQGFCNEAIERFNSVASFFAARATDKETKAAGDKIVTVRVPDAELPRRYSEYAKVLTQTANAYGRRGSLISADSAFKAAQSWIRRHQKFMGESNLSLVENNYLYAKMLIDNGNEEREKELEFENILSDLKKRANPTNPLANELYLAYLHQLLVEDNRPRYMGTKVEYQKVLDKSFPKSSLIQINLKAVEFDSKLARDKTKDLEQDAAALLKSKNLPRNYRTTEHVLDFLLEVALHESRYANAENYLTQITEIRKELYGDNSPTYHLSKIRLGLFLS
ncbi:MAG: hypothetical protein QM762_22465 [Chryseolinea sp.]